MDLQLKDKVVVITGGAKGIGAAITRTCAQEGAIAIVADRDKLACEQLQDELRGHSLEIGTIAIELSPAEHCKEIVEHAVKKLGASTRW